LNADATVAVSPHGCAKPISPISVTMLLALLLGVLIPLAAAPQAQADANTVTRNVVANFESGSSTE